MTKKILSELGLGIDSPLAIPDAPNYRPPCWPPQRDWPVIIAKEDGRDCVREYLEDFDKAVQARFQMLRDLRTALEQNQLTLYFQPQLDLRSGRIIGAEA